MEFEWIVPEEELPSTHETVLVTVLSGNLRYVLPSCRYNAARNYWEYMVVDSHLVYSGNPEWGDVLVDEEWERIMDGTVIAWAEYPDPFDGNRRTKRG